jgi:hypothetical protein
LPLKNRTSILSVLFATAAISCAPRADVPSAPAARAPQRKPVDSHALVLAALDCVMAPVVYDAPPWASNDEQVASYGPEAASCTKAAQAAHVGSARIYRVDSDALLDLRHAIRRGSAGPSRDPADMLALFDQSLAAIMEARRARTALVKGAPHPSTEAVEKIRARTLVVKLDDYGQRRGGPLGTEAKAVARVIAANAFLQVARVDALVRPYVAEPLFTILFGSEFLSESPDEPPASWSEYVAAAARAIPGRPGDQIADIGDTASDGAAQKAIGGGPVENERGDLRAVADAAAADLRSLATNLPSGTLHGAVERTVAKLVAFDVESAATPTAIRQSQK